MMELIGWIGSTLFAICAVPQARRSWKLGHSRGLDPWFLWMWFFGEVLTLIYVLPTGMLPLIFNYIFNFLCLLVILRYYYWPREK
jgi:uncharacterized protein with PQ loop repeat